MMPQHFVIQIDIFVSICFSILQFTAAYLLFPNYTVLQLTASISIPITDLPPNRKILWDWGLQMNYNMPYDPTSFFNAPIWPRNERDIVNARRQRSEKVSAKYCRAYESNETITRLTSDASRNRHISDFTAGELYKSLERLIESYGYHSSCLLQAVCDLAKHPFDIKERHLITDVITFLLTPSWHLGFDTSEERQRKIYEAAEKSGNLGLNCKKLYIICNKNLLELLTHVIFDNN